MTVCDSNFFSATAVIWNFHFHLPDLTPYCWVRSFLIILPCAPSLTPASNEFTKKITFFFLQVKTQLAEKALQAAKAAEAALAGKQAVVEQLQQEVKEAEAVVAENTAAVHQQQGTVNAAVQAAQQATAQVSYHGLNSFFFFSLHIFFNF